MSHTRFALGFSRHRKVAGLSDAAFRLWASAMDRAREQASDGFVDDTDLDLVPRCPGKGSKRTALVKELLAVGLWEADLEGWRIHDFLDWQDSAEQIRARRENARQRMRKLRENSSENVRANNTSNNERTAEAVRHVASDSYSCSISDLNSGSGSERGDARGERDGPAEDPGEDPGRQTLCPMDLADRLEANGTLRRLSEQLPAPLESVRACAKGFVATWTIGKLAGQKRSGWAGRCRQWVIDQHAQGKLRPPGALEHEARSGVYIPPNDGLSELLASIGRPPP